jgi:hypothetical protein
MHSTYNVGVRRPFIVLKLAMLACNGWVLTWRPPRRRRFLVTHRPLATPSTFSDFFKVGAGLEGFGAHRLDSQESYIQRSLDPIENTETVLRQSIMLVSWEMGESPTINSANAMQAKQQATCVVLKS